MTPDSIFAAFSRSADAAGPRDALVMPEGGTAYATLRAEALRLADAIAALGGDFDAIAMTVGDPRMLLTAFLACAALGRPALILDPARPFAESRRVAEASGARLLMLDEHTLSFPDTPAPGIHFARRPPLHAAEAEFYWGLTSGTTGEPKLFARSHRSWLESFRASDALFPFPTASRILIPGPLSHSLFLYGAVHALAQGHTVVAPGAFRPDRAALAARDADVAWLVPAMLAEMLDHGLRPGRLTRIFCGGAKLPPELRERCEARLPAVDLIAFYGASETSFISYSSTLAPAPRGSVGRPFPGVRLAILGEDRTLLPDGAEGAVHVASPMLFSRYVGGTDAGEWFTAGDLGVIDTEGCLHLTGRANRIINSRALKIRPEPIEQALCELPGIARAGVVDLPDATRGAIAVAAVEFAGGAHLPRRTLSAQCRGRLGARFSPRRYFAAKRLPLTRSGKVALAELRAALLAGDPDFQELI